MCDFRDAIAVDAGYSLNNVDAMKNFTNLYRNQGCHFSHLLCIMINYEK